MQSAKFFLEEIVDDEYERMLYLDCDKIINDTLEELWNMSLEGKIGAVLAAEFSHLYRKNIYTCT